MRRQNGQVLIEMAIVLPLLLLLVLGICDYGRMLYWQNSLTNAARSGARTASVSKDVKQGEGGLLSSGSLSSTGQAVKSSLFNGIPADSVKYDVVIRDKDTGLPIAGAVAAGNVIEVTVTSGDFNMITPFYKIAAIITNSSAPTESTRTLTGKASMRYELSN